MTEQKSTDSSAEANPNPGARPQINELGELVFLVLNYCTTEPQASNYNQLAAEMGVPVAQAVAASIAGTILEHYKITPKVIVERQDA
jgi:hypothetical protein